MKRRMFVFVFGLLAVLCAALFIYGCGRNPAGGGGGGSSSIMPPRIEWQNVLGGSERDRGWNVIQTSDGGYILFGDTYSNDGDVSGNPVERDIWLVKLSSTAEVEWQRCLGGSNWEWASAIQQTSDGGYIVAGRTDSNDGDVSGHKGGEDFWVVKLNSTAEVEWQRCLGGSGYDRPYSVQQTTDGGYIVAGRTNSNDGDVSGNKGGDDVWVVKLDSTGGIVWPRCLGGSKWDEAYAVQQTADGGYIVAGRTDSNDGDVSGNKGADDLWLVKLNSTGGIVWQKCFAAAIERITFLEEAAQHVGYDYDS